MLSKKPCPVRCAGWGFSFFLMFLTIHCHENKASKAKVCAQIASLGGYAFEETLPGALRRVGFSFLVGALKSTRNVFELTKLLTPPSQE